MRCESSENDCDGHSSSQIFVPEAAPPPWDASAASVGATAAPLLAGARSSLSVGAGSSLRADAGSSFRAASLDFAAVAPLSATRRAPFVAGGGGGGGAAALERVSGAALCTLFTSGDGAVSSPMLSSRAALSPVAPFCSFTSSFAFSSFLTAPMVSGSAGSAGGALFAFVSTFAFASRSALPPAFGTSEGPLSPFSPASACATGSSVAELPPKVGSSGGAAASTSRRFFSSFLLASSAVERFCSDSVHLASSRRYTRYPTSLRELDGSSPDTCDGRGAGAAPRGSGTRAMPSAEPFRRRDSAAVAVAAPRHPLKKAPAAADTALPRKRTQSPGREPVDAMTPVASAAMDASRVLGPRPESSARRTSRKTDTMAPSVSPVRFSAVRSCSMPASRSVSTTAPAAPLSGPASACSSSSSNPILGCRKTSAAICAASAAAPAAFAAAEAASAAAWTAPSTSSFPSSARTRGAALPRTGRSGGWSPLARPLRARRAKPIRSSAAISALRVASVAFYLNDESRCARVSAGALGLGGPAAGREPAGKNVRGPPSFNFPIQSWGLEYLHFLGRGQYGGGKRVEVTQAPGNDGPHSPGPSHYIQSCPDRGPVALWQPPVRCGT